MNLTFNTPAPTKLNFLTDLKGSSLYQEWLKIGNEGTMTDFLNWLANSTGGMPTVIADSLTSFNGINSIGEYTIQGKQGLYIGSWSNSLFKQTVIWDNNIYVRELNVTTTPVVYHPFKNYGSDLFQSKITSEQAIQYFQDASPDSPITNSYWYAPTSKVLQKLMLFGSTTIWVPQTPLSSAVYKFEGKSYLWSGSDMILLASGSIETKTGVPFSIGDIAFGGVIGYILQSGDYGYDPIVQKGIVVNLDTNYDSVAWNEIDASSLPSEIQLIQLLTTKNIISNWYDGSYWTSTETDASNAKAVNSTTSVSGIESKESLLFARYAWIFEHSISAPEEEDIVVYGKNGQEIKSSGRKLTDFATKKDLENIQPSDSTDYVKTSDIIGEAATKTVKEASNSATVGGQSPDGFAKLDAEGQVAQNISSEKIIGVIDPSNLPGGFIDEITNVKFWQADYPTTQEEGDYFYMTLDNVLWQYINGGWTEIIPAQNVIYNNFSTPNEAHPHRWSGTMMVSTENPLSFASEAEAQEGENTSKVMSALRVMQAFIYHVANKTFTFNGISQSIKSAIDDLYAKIITNASQLTYDNPTYTTVAAALNKLLYVAPTSTSFTNNVNTVEKGVTVSAVTFNWATTGNITSQAINNGVGAITPGTFTKALTGLNLTVNTTWTLTVGDGTNTMARSTAISFMNKMYWGVSTLETLTDANIIVLSSQFSTSRVQARTLDASGGKYLYFIMPTSFACNASKFKIGGLFNSDWQVTTRSFVNASGYAESYMIFRSTNIQTGSAIAVEVV